MSSLTVFFLLVIVVCSLFTLLLNRVTTRLGQLEISQDELEDQQKIRQELQQHTDVTEEELAAIETAIESAQQSLNAAVVAYNDIISRFPGKFIALLFGFKPVSDDKNKLIDPL